MKFYKEYLVMEKFIRDVLAEMSVADKIKLVYGRSTMSIGGLEKYGIREVFMADGPQGIRREGPGMNNTALPCGLALAAGFDPELAEQYGSVIAEEARACGVRVSLGPGMNLMRTPLNGRTFEYYGEDPVLAGKIASGYVRGCQAKNVAATPKHLALNNQEICRTIGDSRCDKDVLRSLYLEAFEIVCREAKPWLVMSSYNKINGIQASACRYTQKEFLKDECGFDGVVISDWHGTWDAVQSLLNGQDLEMPGGENARSATELASAFEKGDIPLEILDEAALRNLRLLYRIGAFDKEENTAGFECNSPAHQEFVRKAACECAVLLKNSGHHLPGAFSKPQKIAIIGPSADFRHNIGSLLKCGGSGAVHAPYEVTVLEAAEKRFGKNCRITYAPGVKFDLENVVDRSVVPDGFTVKYFESENAMSSGEAPFLVRNEDKIDLRFGELNVSGVSSDPRFEKLFALECEGCIVPRRSTRMSLQAAGTWFCSRLFVDGAECAASGNEVPGYDGVPLFHIDVEAGKPLTIRLQAWRARLGTAELSLRFRDDIQEGIREAVALAKDADQVIYVGGTHHGYDKEAIGWGNVAGADIPDIQLPSDQDELICKLAEVNPQITVVLINGSVVNTSAWFDKVRAVVEMFYPGMECGNSVLDILEGKASPGGRLPFSWSDDLNDYPSIANGSYPGSIDTDPPVVYYPEGGFIGYRYFDREKIKLRFPFGYGLSYADFEHELLETEMTGSRSVRLLVRVKNVSEYSGSSVIQLYLGREDDLPERPEKVLRNFVKVHLGPGEEKIIGLLLDERDFSYYSKAEEKISFCPGNYRIYAGINSREFFAETEVAVK